MWDHCASVGAKWHLTAGLEVKDYRWNLPEHKALGVRGVKVVMLKIPTAVGCPLVQDSLTPQHKTTNFNPPFACEDRHVTCNLMSHSDINMSIGDANIELISTDHLVQKWKSTDLY